MSSFSCDIILSLFFTTNLVFLQGCSRDFEARVNVPKHRTTESERTALRVGVFSTAVSYMVINSFSASNPDLKTFNPGLTGRSCVLQHRQKFMADVMVAQRLVFMM